MLVAIHMYTQVLYDTAAANLAHIGLYAIKDIWPGEELTYNYCYSLLKGKGMACGCGAQTCRGRLYWSSGCGCWNQSEVSPSRSDTSGDELFETVMVALYGISNCSMCGCVQAML